MINRSKELVSLYDPAAGESFEAIEITIDGEQAVLIPVDQRPEYEILADLLLNSMRVWEESH